MNNKNTQRNVIIACIVVLVAAFVVYHIHRSKSTPAQPVNTVSYSCDAGKTITAVYYEGATTPAPSPDQPPVPGGSVMLTLSDGRTMTLKQTISADGTRYANSDESFVFWSKGNGALVLENNEEKSYIGCIVTTPPEPSGQGLSQVYSNSEQGFSLRLPEGYTTDESYKYQALGPGKDIFGVKFTIPASLYQGTNLSSDSYLSVEEIPQTSTCSASLFVTPGSSVKTLSDNGTTYSVAIASDAGAGNRYDETVYAIPGTNPCIGVRYFFRYTVLDNYPAGTVKQFDGKALLDQFDQIRRTLVVSQ